MRENKPVRAVDVGRQADLGLASRSRAATELIRRHERTLRRTARRYSLCADDAEDAFQRALEILLTKAPTSDQRDLVRWMQTVTKHEALAVRRNRERSFGTPTSTTREEDSDWVQLIPFDGEGPADAAERREQIGKAREALISLKPQELRALTLLAHGYSYAEIGEITGWSYTKVNRCLAEGRQRFRAMLGSIEEGRRCEELAPVLSAFVDGEARSPFRAELLAHLRGCGHCRAKVRAYRAAPRAAAALAPAVPATRSIAGRLQELAGAVHSRLPGRTGAAEAAVNQLAATGGTRGSGMTLVAKALAVCAGTAGGAAACVAAGVVPPVHVAGHGGIGGHIQRAADESRASPDTGQLGADPIPPAAPEQAPNPEPVDPEPVDSSSARPPTAAPQAAAEFSPEVPAAPTAPQPSSGEFGGVSGSAGGSGGGGATARSSGDEFGP